jgi:hypothetical protein
MFLLQSFGSQYNHINQIRHFQELEEALLVVSIHLFYSYYIQWAALAGWFFVFFITSMISGMFENLLHSYFVLFNIHVLGWNTTTHSIKDLNLFGMYLCIDFIADICITIKSHQSNQTRSTTWQTLKGCKYSSYFIPFCNLQYMYMYNLFRLRTIKKKYWNSTRK